MNPYRFEHAAAPAAGMSCNAKILHALLLVVNIDGGLSHIDSGDHVCTTLLADDMLPDLALKLCGHSGANRYLLPEWQYFNFD